jgi:hypothetical protein
MEVVDSRVKWQAFTPTLLSIRLAVVVFEPQEPKGERKYHISKS